MNMNSWAVGGGILGGLALGGAGFLIGSEWRKRKERDKQEEQRRTTPNVPQNPIVHSHPKTSSSSASTQVNPTGSLQPVHISNNISMSPQQSVINPNNTNTTSNSEEYMPVYILPVPVSTNSTLPLTNWDNNWGNNSGNNWDNNWGNNTNNNWGLTPFSNNTPLVIDNGRLYVMNSNNRYLPTTNNTNTNTTTNTEQPMIALTPWSGGQTIIANPPVYLI